MESASECICVNISVPGIFVILEYRLRLKRAEVFSVPEKKAKYFGCCLKRYSSMRDFHENLPDILIDSSLWKCVAYGYRKLRKCVVLWLDCWTYDRNIVVSIPGPSDANHFISRCSNSLSSQKCVLLKRSDIPLGWGIYASWNRETGSCESTYFEKLAWHFLSFTETNV